MKLGNLWIVFGFALLLSELDKGIWWWVAMVAAFILTSYGNYIEVKRVFPYSSFMNDVITGRKKEN